MSRRVAIGKWANGVGSGFGIRTSLPGKDALSSDDRDISFNSDWTAQTPIIQAGSFELGNGSTNISYPNYGYTPFGLFMVKRGQPKFGNPTYIDSGIDADWEPYNNGGILMFDPDNGKSALNLQIYADHLSAQYVLQTPGNNTLGWPASVIIAYVIYRIAAFF